MSNTTVQKSEVMVMWHHYLVRSCWSQLPIQENTPPNLKSQNFNLGSHLGSDSKV